MLGVRHSLTVLLLKNPSSTFPPPSSLRLPVTLSVLSKVSGERTLPYYAASPTGQICPPTSPITPPALLVSL